MRVKRLEMEAFRGFENCTLEFNDAQTTVLVGENGAGKSSVLDCLAILLSWYTEGLRVETFKGLKFQNYDIKTGYKELHCRISTIIGGEDIQWTIGHRDAIRKKASFSQISDLAKHINNLFKIYENSWRDMCIPALIYYGLDRGNTKITGSEDWDNSQKNFAAYLKCLEGTADFNGFFKWFKFREGIENSKKAKIDPDFSDKQLDAVRAAIKKFKSLGAYSDIYVDLEASPQSLMIKKKFGKNKTSSLSINQLSAGEKALITMVADIARRLAITHESISDPLSGSGVVLIDEIELHLHPRWQTRIIDDLERTFPNLQFIITTHSPYIVNTIKHNSNYILEQKSKGIIAHGPVAMYGRESDEILEEIFGELRRPQKINKKLGKYFQLIDQNKLSEAKKIRTALEKEIGPDDPEFTRADALLRRREILKK